MEGKYSFQQHLYHIIIDYDHIQRDSPHWCNIDPDCCFHDLHEQLLPVRIATTAKNPEASGIKPA
jgi:hypothetical protein